METGMLHEKPSPFAATDPLPATVPDENVALLSPPETEPAVDDHDIPLHGAEADVS